MSGPKMLFRYTNVDSLRYILRDRTIRFSDLTTMDDPDEAWSSVDRQEGRHVFISSWTDKQEEDPRMWSSYCRPDMTHGVRIAMPRNPFSTTENKIVTHVEACKKMTELFIRRTDWVLRSYYHRTPSTLEETKTLLSRLKREHPKAHESLMKELNEAQNKEYYSVEPTVNELLQVCYTDDPELVYPEIHTRTAYGNFVHFEAYGRCKTKAWAWQQEWRYLLHFRMLNNGVTHRDGTIDLYPLPFDHVDWKLKEEAVRNMTITLSPTISEQNRKTVETMVSESPFPNIRISDSELYR